MRLAFAAPLALLATWDSWRWYLLRVWATPEEAMALVAVAALVAMPLLRGGPPRQVWLGPGRLMLLAGLLGLHAATAGAAPAILRAGLAVLVLLCLIEVLTAASTSSDRPPSAAGRGDATVAAPPPALWLIGLLALPIVPTLQFYLGYPMRIVSAAISVALLQLNGLMVERQGTFLVWRGELVQFDAPCSGVSMLWAGLLLTGMLAYLHRLDLWRTAIAVLACAAMLVAGNVLRASSLFYLETGLIAQAPAWWHEAVGIAAFAAAALAIVIVIGRLKPCPA